MAKLKGLGRGISALIQETTQTGEQDSLQLLSVDLLMPGRYQPRQNMDQAALESLAESIKAQGLMQPILVRPLPNLKYEIIAGERRWRASQMAGLDKINCLIRSVPDQIAMAMALIENIQRENLNPLEEAVGIQRLIQECGLTHEDAAQQLGRSRSAVSNFLRLLNLTEPVRELLMQGQIEMGHARALLGLEGDVQIATAKEVANKCLSVRQTEALVKQREINNQAPAPRAQKILDPQVESWQTTLAQKLGASVQIENRRGGKARIVIEYGNIAELEKLLERIQ